MLGRPRVPRMACVAPLILSEMSGATAAGSADMEAAARFIRSRGHSDAVTQRILKELSDPGWAVPKGDMHKFVVSLAGRWEVGEDAGLESLALSIVRQLALEGGSNKLHVWIRPPSGERPFKCEAFEGMTLRDICISGEDEGSLLLKEYLECACSGVMACSTCHVYVGDKWVDSLPPIPDEEEDMLELAYERSDSSRLGCQIILSAALDGLEISLPKGANNMFDDIPFG
uniref:2Fe-2S ferredoxin-type domain-containing protein n=1 Tax=Coccolithus braarudii TaxID=221442 RepID=A0A7S0PYF3_9EUKA